MPETLLLRGGRLVCPETGTDDLLDVRISDGRVTEIGAQLPPAGARVLDCSGAVIAPGWTDLGTELCDPGLCDREDLCSGSEAGAAGGYTLLIAGPSTDPVVDGPAVAADVVARAKTVSGASVQCSGAITLGLKGEHLAEVGLMIEAGCVALSDGRVAIADAGVLRRVLQYIRPFDVPVFLRPAEPSLEADGVMNESSASMHAGLRGIHSAGEELGCARIIALVRATGTRVHLTQVTTAAGVNQVRRAKADGLPITAAVPARHLLLTDAEVERSVYDTATRLLPPLRTESDRQACIAGLRDGTLDAITADHVPWTRIDKELEFMHAKPGANGLETALGAAWVALDGDAIAVVKAMAVGPAAVLGRSARIAAGAPADVVIFHPEREWTPEAPFRSRGGYDPLSGRALMARVFATVVHGRVVFGPRSD
jgi:dihydroorotase